MQRCNETSLTWYNLSISLFYTPLPKLSIKTQGYLYHSLLPPRRKVSLSQSNGNGLWLFWLNWTNLHPHYFSQWRRTPNKSIIICMNTMISYTCPTQGNRFSAAHPIFCRLYERNLSSREYDHLREYNDVTCMLYLRISIFGERKRKPFSALFQEPGKRCFPSLWQCCIEKAQTLNDNSTKTSFKAITYTKYCH